ncbi:hypothetical protein DFP78_113103 [Photobacterium lutimaris]|nr:hypothetical protein DFP78_113103 [Photobacterium lutimaris]
MKIQAILTVAMAMASASASAFAVDTNIFDESERFEKIEQATIPTEYLAEITTTTDKTGNVKQEVTRDQFWTGSIVYLDKETSVCLKVTQELVSLDEFAGIQLPHLNATTITVDCPA